MAKNIMLMFLSDVKTIKNENKTGRIVSQAKYEGIEDETVTTYTTNESAVRYVLKNIKDNAKLDKIFVFASKLVLTIPINAEDVPIDEVTGEHLTHYQYFKFRLKELKLDVEKLLTEDNGKNKGTVYPYDEMQISGAENQYIAWQSMGQILEMASRIQSYVQEVKKKNSNEEVILHVDCTGGLRNAAMMTVAVMRLMQYQHIVIGKVLYSNYNGKTKRGTVEEVNEIYNLFDLIAGAEEFVRFGSVNAIKNYFENRNIPKSLQDLLNAMDKFAEAIKICRRGEFQEALEELQTAYQNFNVAQQQMPTVKDISSLNYNLMQQLESRIGQEYSFLLQNKSDDYLSIIDWCLDHGYLQQAMTLYTECIPYMLINKDKKIILSNFTKTDLKKKVKKDSMKREPEFFLLNEYSPNGYNNIFNSYKAFVKVLQVCILDIRKNRFDMQVFQQNNSFANWSAKGIIKSDFEEYKQLLDDLQKLKANSNLATNEETILKNLPTLHSFIQLIPKNTFEIKNLDKRIKKMFVSLENANYRAFIRKNANTLIIYYMIINDMLILNSDEEKLLKFMDRYFIIKQERNDSAHARLIPQSNLTNQSSGKSYAEILKEYMKEGIREYSSI